MLYSRIAEWPFNDDDRRPLVGEWIPTPGGMGFLRGDWDLFPVTHCGTKVHENVVLPELGEEVSFSYPNPSYAGTGTVVGYAPVKVRYWKTVGVAVKGERGLNLAYLRDGVWKWGGSYEFPYVDASTWHRLDTFTECALLCLDPRFPLRGRDVITRVNSWGDAGSVYVEHRNTDGSVIGGLPIVTERGGDKHFVGYYRQFDVRDVPNILRALIAML